MKAWKKIIAIIGTCFGLSAALMACQPSPSLSIPPETYSPIATLTSTSTVRLATLTSTPIATPSLTPLPSYQTKEILFGYIASGFHTSFEMFYKDYTATSPYILLYTDRQMIFPGKPPRQKMLSQSEIDQFVSKLEALGFFTIESNQQHDPTDKLYDFGDQYGRIHDGGQACISVYTTDKARDLCVYEPFTEFLVPKMKSILKFLDDYEPAGMSVYTPDRILLWVQSGRSPYDSNLPKTAVSWPEPSLSLETDNEKILYADGEMARELYRLYGDQGYIFRQNGKEYTVYMEIVWPHEEITNQH